MSYTVLRKQNDYLNDYIGKTMTKKLSLDAHRFLFESAPYMIDRKLEKIEKEFSLDIMGKMRKKSIVSCLEPLTKEILSIGGSSLLLDKKTGKVIDNLITDNLGKFLGQFFGSGGATFNVQNDANIATAILVWGLNGQAVGRFNVAWNLSGVPGPAGSGGLSRFGSGLLAPSRGDFAIQTPLGAAPESGYIGNANNGYTIGNQEIYNITVSSTGGAGTVNELGTFLNVVTGAQGTANIMIAHDAVSPGVNYTIGRLLIGSYTWQI